MPDYIDTQADIAAIEETADAFGTAISNYERDLQNQREALLQSRKYDLGRAGLVETKPDGTKVVDKDRRK